MCSLRLGARVGAVRAVGRASLSGHQVRFHVRSQDGSSKADCVACEAPDEVAWGVLYEMTPAAKVILDGYEGLGRSYVERVVTPMLDGRPVEAFAYVGHQSRIAAGMAPYSWYRGHVVRGAREHGLPVDYVRRLEAVAANDDPDVARHRREAAIAAATSRTR